MSYHAYLAGEPDGYHDEAGLVGRIAASPAVIAANNLAAQLIDILGPSFWAALVVLYAFAQISSH